jgi:UDP-N-acetylglucosamine acyltransferase
VDPRAELGDSVEIGPGVVVQGPVQIGARTRIVAQAFICGHTTLGEDCLIHPFAAIGSAPQDRAYKGERSYVRIGPRCELREGVTVHCGTQPETETVIGADCLLMANSHVAHNCRIDDNVTLVNGVLLAGHVRIGKRVTMGGAAVAHQFVEIGEFVMVGGAARATQDLAPYMSFTERNYCLGVNRIGLRRNGFGVEEINELNDLHRLIFRSREPLGCAAKHLSDRVQTAPGRRLIEFILQPHRRGLAGRLTQRRESSVEA